MTGAGGGGDSRGYPPLPEQESQPEPNSASLSLQGRRSHLWQSGHGQPRKESTAMVVPSAISIQNNRIQTFIYVGGHLVASPTNRVIARGNARCYPTIPSSTAHSAQWGWLTPDWVGAGAGPTTLSGRPMGFTKTEVVVGEFPRVTD